MVMNNEIKYVVKCSLRWRLTVLNISHCVQSKRTQTRNTLIFDLLTPNMKMNKNAFTTYFITFILLQHSSLSQC